MLKFKLYLKKKKKKERKEKSGKFRAELVPTRRSAGWVTAVNSDNSAVATSTPTARLQNKWGPRFVKLTFRCKTMEEGQNPPFFLSELSVIWRTEPEPNPNSGERSSLIHHFQDLGFQLYSLSQC